MIVVHDKHGANSADILFRHRLGTAAPKVYGFPRDRQQHRESGSLIGLTQNSDGAVMSTYDAKGCREAESAAQELRGEEWLENSVAGFLIHSLARVGHVYSDVVPRGNRESLGPEMFTTLGEMLDRDTDAEGTRLVSNRFPTVDDQVHDQLLELSAVTVHSGTNIWNVHDQCDLLGDRCPDKRADFRNQLANVDRLNDELAFAGIGKELPR